MPIYEYKCTNVNCAHHDEVIEMVQKMSDDPLTRCSTCQQESLKKIISISGFRLKGGGWYETDFKSSGQKKNVVSSEGKESSSTNSSGTTEKKAGESNSQSNASSSTE